MCSSSLQELQNYNSLINNHQQKNVGSHQKQIPCIQGQRRSHRKMVGGAKSRLESNPIPARDAQRAQTNLVCTKIQRRHETEPELCLSVSCRGMGQQWTTAGAGALDAIDVGVA